MGEVSYGLCTAYPTAPNSYSNRLTGFSNGRIFNSHGKLIASTSQEGVIRTFLSNEQKSESSTTQSIPMNDKKAMYSSGYAKSAIDGATTEQRWIELGVANHTRALDAKL